MDNAKTRQVKELGMTAFHVSFGARMAEVNERIIRRTLDWWNAKSLEDRAVADRTTEEKKSRLAALTPQEKWARIKSPTCIDDYGLSMTREEVCAVPEAKCEVEAYIQQPLAQT